MFKKLLAVCLSCLIFLLPTTPANAEPNKTETEVKVGVHVKKGTLSIQGPKTKNIDFNTITIDGSTQTLELDLEEFIISDFRGEGAGWNVTVEASKFVSGNRELPKSSSFQLEGVKYIEPVNTSSPLPQVYEGPFILDVAGVHTILSAKKDEGMGQYKVKFKPLKLILNTSELYHGNYKSTITYSITTGP